MHTEETRVVFKFNECKTSLIDNSDLGFSLKSICRGGAIHIQPRNSSNSSYWPYVWGQLCVLWVNPPQSL